MRTNIDIITLKIEFIFLIHIVKKFHNMLSVFNISFSYISVSFYFYDM